MSDWACQAVCPLALPSLPKPQPLPRPPFTIRSSLHHRDFSSALDHLHRFFDYTQAEGGLAGAQPAGAGGLARDEAAARSRLQSAALSLGAMHAQLGHVEEAMQALNETVRRWDRRAWQPGG